MSFNHLKAMAFATSAAVALVGSAAWAQAPARAQFDIPAQDLGAALRSLGVQAGREVLFDPAVVDGLRAPAVRGDMAVSSAVQRLLVGQGLRSRESGRTIIIERAPAAAFPECERFVSIVGSRLANQLQQRTVDGRAIVIGEIVQAGFLDETAEFDQVTGAFATLHNPAPRISPTPRRFQPLDQRPIATLRQDCRRQQLAHLCARAAERRRRPSHAMPPSHQHPS